MLGGLFGLGVSEAKLGESAVRGGALYLLFGALAASAIEAQTLPPEGATQEVTVGLRFRECDVCPEMVVVPAGQFVMGMKHEFALDSDGNAFIFAHWLHYARPLHRVRMAERFAVGVHEVTFREWDACERDFGCGIIPDDEGWGRGNRPVINVSWNDAREYVGWLSEKTGNEYRLLTESEWEYVARAGTTTRFHTGQKISRRQANFNHNYFYNSKGRVQRRQRSDEFIRKTVPVGQFPPNRFGLHDVHGNVWEWVQDCWNKSYDGAPRDGSAWESGDCESRVLRGGSWDGLPRNLRAAYRDRSTTGSRNYDYGFRVARTLAP